MPGIISTVTTRSGRSSTGTEAGTFFVAGITERGRTDVLGTVRSISDYAQQYGGRVTYGSLYDALRVFFEEGGSTAKVARVVGPAATEGTLTLMDSEATPAETITLDALGAGDWSANVDVDVAAGSLSGTFKITIAYGDITEVYDNLSTAADAVQKINLRSDLVRATDEGAGTDPADGSFSLAAGDDDRAAVTATHYTDQLTALADATTAPGLVAIPGQTADAVGAALLAYAEANRKIAILASAITADVAAAKADAAALIDSPGAEYGGLVFPSITINHNGALIDVSPEGYVAGVRARAVADAGPWRAPAGQIAASTTIVEPTVEVDQTTGDDLDASGVSAIRTIYGSPRLYGWRSLSSDVENYGLLTNGDIVNFVLSEVEKVMEEFVFEPIDARGQLFSSLKGSIIGVLQPIASAGGLFAQFDGSNEVDPGYRVVTDETVNTTTTLQQSKLRADVSIRPSPSAALIEFNLTKVSLTSAV